LLYPFWLRTKRDNAAQYHAIPIGFHLLPSSVSRFQSLIPEILFLSNKGTGAWLHQNTA
jgi:hypothetical protein